MESSNNSSSQDANSRPPVDRGSGNGGRGASHDNNGGCGNRRRGNNRDNHNDDNNKRSQFTGQESAMNGHVFDYTGECRPEKYIRTMKELLTHVSLTYKEYTTELKENWRTWLLWTLQHQKTHTRVTKLQSKSGRWISRSTMRN